LPEISHSIVIETGFIRCLLKLSVLFEICLSKTVSIFLQHVSRVRLLIDKTQEPREPDENAGKFENFKAKNPPLSKYAQGPEAE
jgi:hypothetical protein